MNELDALRKLRHDVRSTFSGMTMCLVVLELDVAPEDKLHFLDEIIHAAERLLPLLDQIEEMAEQPGGQWL